MSSSDASVTAPQPADPASRALMTLRLGTPPPPDGPAPLPLLAPAPRPPPLVRPASAPPKEKIKYPNTPFHPGHPLTAKKLRFLAWHLVALDLVPLAKLSENGHRALFAGILCGPLDARDHAHDIRLHLHAQVPPVPGPHHLPDGVHHLPAHPVLLGPPQPAQELRGGPAGRVEGDRRQDRQPLRALLPGPHRGLARSFVPAAQAVVGRVASSGRRSDRLVAQLDFDDAGRPRGPLDTLPIDPYAGAPLPHVQRGSQARGPPPRRLLLRRGGGRQHVRARIGQAHGRHQPHARRLPGHGARHPRRAGHRVGLLVLGRPPRLRGGGRARAHADPGRDQVRLPPPPDAQPRHQRAPGHQHARRLRRGAQAAVVRGPPRRLAQGGRGLRCAGPVAARLFGGQAHARPDPGAADERRGRGGVRLAAPADPRRRAQGARGGRRCREGERRPRGGLLPFARGEVRGRGGRAAGEGRIQGAGRVTALGQHRQDGAGGHWDGRRERGHDVSLLYSCRRRADTCVLCRYSVECCCSVDWPPEEEE